MAYYDAQPGRIGGSLLNIFQNSIKLKEPLSSANDKDSFINKLLRDWRVYSNAPEADIKIKLDEKILTELNVTDENSLNNIYSLMNEGFLKKLVNYSSKSSIKVKDKQELYDFQFFIIKGGGEGFLPPYINNLMKYSFSWDDIPKDNNEFLKYLKSLIKSCFDIKKENVDNWLKSAIIKKSDNLELITVTNGTESLTFKLNKNENSVLLTTSKNETKKYILKEENGKQKLYPSINANAIAKKSIDTNGTIRKSIWDYNDILIVFDKTGKLIGSSLLERPTFISIKFETMANIVYNSWNNKTVGIYKNSTFTIKYLGLYVNDGYRISCPIDIHKREATNGCMFIAEDAPPMPSKTNDTEQLYKEKENALSNFEPKLINSILSYIVKKPEDITEDGITLGIMKMIDLSN